MWIVQTFFLFFSSSCWKKAEKEKISFLGKACKEDLQCLAEELGEKPVLDVRIVDLKKLTIASKNYEVEFVQGVVGNDYRN